MTTVERQTGNSSKSNVKLYVWIVVLAVLAGSVYGFAQSDQYTKIKNQFKDIQNSVSEAKDLAEEMQQKVMEAYERQEEFESYDRYEREEDKGFAYDDFETDYDYEM